jgi:hypothetical protein
MMLLDRLFEPGPPKDRGFENRGRGVGVILQQLRRIAAVEAEIQPAVEAGIVAVPAGKSAARMLASAR